MKWYEASDDDNPYYRVYVLLNDKTDVLARVETFDGGNVFYPWIMDVADTSLLRRVGSVMCTARQIKVYCEKVLVGEIPQDHDRPYEPRPLRAGLPLD